MKSFLAVTVIAALILAVVVFAFRNQAPRFVSVNPTETPVPKKTLKIGESEVKVEIADSTEKMRLGLGERNSLADREGMLFLYNIKRPAVFWMKGMRFPLDIIWIADGKVVQIDKQAPHEPGVADPDLKRYISNEPVDAVLEVNAGFAEKNGIKVGDPVVIP
jgi:hypothetical protein